MSRPAVDVVVPFRGSAAALQELRDRLGRLRLAPGDSLLVVDNTSRREPLRSLDGDVRVMPAAERSTPGFARNRGAAQGRAQWIVFLDADTMPSVDLLDRYFDPPPHKRTAQVGGGVLDEDVPAGGPVAARYAFLRGAMAQQDSFRFAEWSYPKTANAACRRAAFEALGGFREDIRAAEDADLTYRLKGAGWEIERRESAMVVHHSRQTVRALVVQRALHGAGGAWLNRNYAGSFPARRRPGLLWWGLRTAATGLVSAARSRDRDEALWAVFDPLETIVWEIGRSLPNERPLPGGAPWSLLLAARSTRARAVALWRPRRR